MALVAATEVDWQQAFPPELWFMALSCLRGVDVQSVRATCRRLKQILDGDKFMFEWPLHVVVEGPLPPSDTWRLTKVTIKGAFVLMGADLAALHQAQPCLEWLNLDCAVGTVSDSDAATIRRHSRHLTFLCVDRQAGAPSDYPFLHPGLETAIVNFTPFFPDFCTTVERLLAASPALKELVVHSVSGTTAALAPSRFDGVTSLDVAHDGALPLHVAWVDLARAFPSLTSIRIADAAHDLDDGHFPNVTSVTICSDDDSPLIDVGGIRADRLEKLEFKEIGCVSTRNIFDSLTTELDYPQLKQLRIQTPFCNCGRQCDNESDLAWGQVGRDLAARYPLLEDIHLWADCVDTRLVKALLKGLPKLEVLSVTARNVVALKKCIDPKDIASTNCVVRLWKMAAYGDTKLISGRGKKPYYVFEP